MARLALFILAATQFAFSVGAAEEVSFKICYEDVPQPPYYYGEGLGIPDERLGLYLELSSLLQKRLQLSISHVRAPWKRCLALMRSNEVDAVYGASFKKDRMAYGRYPMMAAKPDNERRLATKSYSLYKNKDAALSWNGKALENNTEVVGAPLGYSIIPFLERLGTTVRTRWTTELGLELVSMGRLAAFAAQDPAADALIADYPEKYANVIKLIPALQTKPYYMMISHGFYDNRSALSEKIWNEAAKIRAEEMPELYQHYTN